MTDLEPTKTAGLEPTTTPEAANPLLAYLQSQDAAPLADWIDHLRVERGLTPAAIAAALLALTDLVLNHAESVTS
jgi:hypothetical protein